MSTVSIMIWATMPLLIVASSIVLFAGKTPFGVVVVPSYSPSVNKLLKKPQKNDGERLTQKQLLDKMDYVSNAFD